METIAINSIEELKHFAEKIANEINPPAVFFLVGEMGTGKTTFAQLFAKAHGVKLPVRSPSFIIHHEYIGTYGEKIHHLDLYRLNNLSELYELKLSGSLSEHAYMLIEWADKFEAELKAMFPHAPHYLLRFSLIDTDKREVTFERI